MKDANRNLFWLGGVLLIVFVFFAYSSEPRYKDKPLSYWGRRYTEDLHNGMLRREFEEAVQVLGPKTAPYLLGEVCWTPPWWKTWLSGLGVKSKFTVVDPRETERHRQCGFTGFGVLGTNALVVIPEITRLLNDPRHCRRVAAVLPALGDFAFPVLSNAVAGTNVIVQRELVKYLCVFENRRVEVQAILERLARSSDEGVRFETMRAFWSSNIPANVAVPILIQALKDKDDSVRYEAVTALMDYGADAISAVPALEQLRQDTSYRAKDQARLAIPLIQRKAQKKKG